MFETSDVEEFAKYLGLYGQDADLFYESCYDKVLSDEEYELMMENYDRIAWTIPLQILWDRGERVGREI